MIPQDAADIARHLRGSLVSLLLLAGTPAVAEDLQPFDAPAEEGWSGSSPLDDPSIPLPEFNTSLPAIDDGADAPSTDGQPADVDTGADFQPPSIDAYLDLALTGTNFDSSGVDDTASGYRLIAGWYFGQAGSDRWSVAPELGYVRLGQASETTVTNTFDPSIPGYRKLITRIHDLDLSALDFGLRARMALTGHIDGYVRAGAHLYHSSTQINTQYSYIPLPPNTPRPDDVLPTESTSENGVGVYGSLGVAVRLGKVPQLYAEYGMRQAGDNQVETTALGFLLNF